MKGPAAIGPPPIVTDADRKQLLAALSPEARSRLEKLTPAEQWPVVADWARQARQTVRVRDARPIGNQRGRLDDDRLARFFEDGVSAEDRDRLMDLPAEEMQRQLLQLYLRQTRPPDGVGNRFDGKKRGPFGPPSGKRLPSDKSAAEPSSSNP